MTNSVFVMKVQAITDQTTLNTAFPCPQDCIFKILWPTIKSSLRLRWCWNRRALADTRWSPLPNTLQILDDPPPMESGIEDPPLDSLFLLCLIAPEAKTKNLNSCVRLSNRQNHSWTLECLQKASKKILPRFVPLFPLTRPFPQNQKEDTGQILTIGRPPCLFYFSLVLLAFILALPWAPWNSLKESTFKTLIKYTSMGGYFTVKSMDFNKT